MVSPEISCNTKNERQAQESVWEHVHPMCTWAWSASQAGSGCTLLSQKSPSAENETVSEAVEEKCPRIGTAYLQEQAKHCERHCSRAMSLHVTVPEWGQRQIWIFFCQQTLTKINLSIWPLMKQASKTKVTSVSRHEPSIFFIFGEKNPSSLLRVRTRMCTEQRCCQRLCSFRCVDVALKAGLVLDLELGLAV